MYDSSYEGNLKLPELGKRDRTVYHVLIGVLSAAGVGGVAVLLAMFLMFPYPLGDPGVAAVNHTLNIFGIIIFAVLLALIVWGLRTGRGRRYPIFGEAGIIYGGPEWTPVYPLLMPTRQAPEKVRYLVREGRQIAGIMAAGVLLAAFVFATTWRSGNFLGRDGSLRVVWGPGWEMACYEPEDVAEIRVDQTRSSGRRSYGSDWRIQLDYTMNDGKKYYFLVVKGEFQQGGEVSQVEILAELLQCYPEGIVRFQDRGMIPRIVFDQGYSEQEQGMLEDLFGIR